MHTFNSILIQADLNQIFKAAATIEDWPRILPHYRWVKVFQRTEHIAVAEMAAKRTGFPVKWTSIQELYPAAGKIVYRHIHGVTRGMYVEWNLQPTPDGVLVSITHDLDKSLYLLGRIISAYIIGRIFIHTIADQTLRGIKKELERQPEATKSTWNKSGESSSQG